MVAAAAGPPGLVSGLIYWWPPGRGAVEGRSGSGESGAAAAAGDPLTFAQATIRKQKQFRSTIKGLLTLFSLADLFIARSLDG